MLKKIKLYEIIMYLILLILLLLPFFNSIGMTIYLRNESVVLNGYNAWDALTYALKQTLSDTTIFDITASPFRTTITAFVNFLGFNDTIAKLCTYWVSVFSGWLVFKVIIVITNAIVNKLQFKKA